MISKSFCILPWVHLSTRPHGRVRACCNAQVIDKESSLFNLGYDDLLSVWNSKYMRDIRLQMIKGEIPESCKTCLKKKNWGILLKEYGKQDIGQSIPI